VFLTFYILQVGLPNVAGPGVTYTPIFPLDGPGCVNNNCKIILPKNKQWLKTDRRARKPTPERIRDLFWVCAT